MTPFGTGYRYNVLALHQYPSATCAGIASYRPATERAVGNQADAELTAGRRYGSLDVAATFL